VQERLQAAERERAVAVAREAEQRKRRRVQLALAVAVLLLGGGAFAWYSDRQASERRAEARNKEQQANQGVDAALNLVPDLRKQYKFQAAKKTLDQAALLAEEGAPDRLAEVEQASRDLAFVVQLDDIRYRKLIWIAGEGGKGAYNPKIAPPEYRRAFAERELDLTSLDPAEAAKRIAASAVKAELVAAVDDWALYEPERDLRDRLLDVARRADPGSWTDRLRGPAVQVDRDAVQKLAAEAGLARTSAATLSVLAEHMKRWGLNAAPLPTAARADHPADFELAFKLGQWHSHSKNGQQIGPYEAARALRPENGIVWNNLGVALKDKGQADEAIACFRRALAIDPQVPNPLNNLGIALKDNGQVDEAIACYRQIIARYPKLRQPHANLGEALLTKSQVDDAIACFQKARDLDPSIAESHSNLGRALHRKGRFDDAIACWRQAIEVAPKYANAHSNLGAALAKKGQMDEAIVYFRQSIALDPKDAVAHCNLAIALSRKGQVEEAIACYRKVVELDPKHVAAHFDLGNALNGQGQVDEVIACYARPAGGPRLPRAARDCPRRHGPGARRTRSHPRPRSRSQDSAARGQRRPLRPRVEDHRPPAASGSRSWWTRKKSRSSV
jgi:tetratricopeptide (TPR) repeat protein